MTQEIQKQNKGDIVGSKNSLKAVMESPDFKESVKSVAGKYLTADHIVKAALLAISRQPKLLSCTKTSFLQSVIKAAELGLDFAGQTGQGYLIPFGKDCTFIPGYQGFIEIAYRSNRVNYIDAQLVYEKDEFNYNLGSNPYIEHRPAFEKDRGKVICGYAVVRLVGSEFPKIEIMSYDDIMKIKARSRAKDSGPWKTDESEMMRKTVLRRVFKYIPKTPELQTAMESDNDLYDLQIEELKDDKSNLGNEGIKTRIKQSKKKVQSKDITEEEPDPATKAKAEEQKKKLQEAEEKLDNPVFTCPDAFDVGCSMKSKQLKIDDDKLEYSNEDEAYICPECGSVLQKVEGE